MTGLKAILLCMAIALAAAAPADERTVMVPMRDGIRLATSISTPAPTGKFPAILIRTPYSRSGHSTFWQDHGYALVIQSVRGRYGSQGHWRLLDDDARDGADTTRWIAAQPWSNQAIATIGSSYEGGTQHALAAGGAPFVKTMIPADAASDIGMYGIRHHGAFELRLMIWILTNGGAIITGTLDELVADPARRAAWHKISDSIPQFLKGLPLHPGASPLRIDPDLESWLVSALQHGNYDQWWKSNPVSVPEHIAEYADIPVYHVTGWYDSWSAQTANFNYPLLAQAKHGPHKLIIGPWIHGGQDRTYAGEAEFGSESAIDFDQFQLRWIDHWTRGIANGAEAIAPVRIFVMGDGNHVARKGAEGRLLVGGHWRDEHEWPLARARPTPFYLNANGLLSANPESTSKPDTYRFNPADPVPTIGGNVSSSADFMWPGAFDQHCRAALFACRNEDPLAQRPDVLVFQTAKLEQSLEATGRLTVDLWASSSALDTDFTAKLIDVYPPSPDFPQGVALNIGDSIIRARYRDDPARASTPLTPGKPEHFRIELYPTSLAFAKGHRIRLDISSSNFPRFDVNPNTGEPLNANTHTTIATNSIYHDAHHPSHLTLPVIVHP